MRRTKHRRRFHTDRVIANRQKLARSLYGSEYPMQREDGRLKHAFAYGDCGRAGCGLCHWSKFFLPNFERAEGARQCRDWWKEI